MPARRTKTLRKQPKQDRSRQLVESLLDATARVLVKHGWDGATTNRIAERAGVSVGSLYQYFPDKESLVGALVDRHVARMRAALETVPLAGPDPESLVRASIAGILRAFAVDPGLRDVIVEQVPAIGRISKLAVFDDWVRARAGSQLEAVGLPPERARVLAWVLVSSLRGACTEPERTRPPGFDDAALEEELVRLATGYLERSGLAPPATAP